MYVTTFFSYRGGVGRTTTLVNVGIDLAERGRKVLLVDFNLEAPGLTDFTPLRPKDGSHPGLVEFVEEFLRSGRAPEIQDYVYQTRPIAGSDAEIWIMPSGCEDDEYWQAVHKINWKELCNSQNGLVFFEDMKFQWKEYLKPDYVFVDARAGINDLSVVCTRWFPDAVVLMLTPDLTPNRGSAIRAGDKSGIVRVLEEVLAESRQTNPARIDVLAVVSKVPELDGEGHVIDADFLLEPYYVTATLPQAPELLRGPQIIKIHRRPKPIRTAYRILANELIRRNCTHDRVGARAFLKELQLHPNRAVATPVVDPEDPWSNGAVKLDQIICNFRHDPDILAEAASCLYLAGRYDDAMGTLDDAIKIDPSSYRIRWQRASYRRRMKLAGWVEDLLELLKASGPAPAASAPARRPNVDELARLTKGVQDRSKSRAPDLGLVGRGLPNPRLPELDTQLRDTSAALTDDFAGINRYVASAFQILNRLAPDRIKEALEQSSIQQLSPELREALINDAPVLPGSATQDPEQLIGDRQWQAAITLLRARLAQSLSPDWVDVLLLAMALWGAGDEALATESCQVVRKWVVEAEAPASFIQRLEADHLEQIPLWSLGFWRAGDPDTARELLDRCDELLAEVPNDEFVSYWRFHSVNRDQFQNDCDSQRKLVRGVAIHPPFLGRDPCGA